MLHPSRVGCRNLKSRSLTRLGEHRRYHAWGNLLALSKRNSRPIVVDGVPYRWAFSAPYDSHLGLHRLNLTIQPENGDGTKLIGTGKCPTNNEYLLESTVIMTPAIVSRVISAAITNGWAVDGDKDWFVDEIEQFASMESRKSRY